MKKWLILFGALDIITLARLLSIKTAFVGIITETQVIVMTVGKWSLYLSLIISAYFLIRQQKIGLWLTYIQFPFRFIFIALSFAFILSIVDFLGGVEWEIDRTIMWLIALLEVVRLLLTIQIHRKYYSTKV